MTLGTYDSNFKTKELGLRNSFRSHTRRFPTLSSLTLTKTKNTWRVCRLCRGSRWNIIKTQVGKLIQKPCAECQGKGRVYTE